MAPQNSSKYDDHSPLYNSRIQALYVQYLEKHYPEIDINALLEYAGMTLDQVHDLNHWFNQIQVNKFHEKLGELTNRDDIARAVGRFMLEANMGWLKVACLGFFSEYVLLAFERSLLKISRAFEVHARRLGSDRIEFTVTPKPGVNPIRHQCENRTGTFEAIGSLFYDEPALVEHPECFHDGKESCQYLLTFRKPPHIIWKDILKVASVFSMIVSLLLFFLLPTDTWGMTLIIFLFSLCGISHISVRKEKEYLSSIIETQKNAAEKRLDEWLFSPEGSLLFTSVNQIGAENISSPERITSNILSQMESRLPFDYGAILLLRNERSIEYLDDYGAKGEKNREGSHPLSGSFTFSSSIPKKPIDLFNDCPLDGVIEKGRDYQMKSARGIPFSQHFREIDVHSLFFFPMLFGKETLGAILVGSYDPDKVISEAFERTLVYFATQTASVLTHSMLYVKLADREGQHRLLMANLKGMVFSYHLDGLKTIDFVSDGCFELTGLQPRSFTSFRSYEQLIHSDDKDQYLSTINKATKNFKEYEIEYRVIGVTGEEKWVWEKGKPVLKDDHSITLEGFITDITERKMTENLRNEIIDRTSHELRTPLHDIILNASPFLEFESYFKRLSANEKNKIERILRTARFMNNTVDDLLSLSRLESNRIVINLRKIPLYGIINDALEGISSHIKEKGHEFRKNIDKELFVEVDKDQMQIVVNNLLGNAVKHTPSNGFIMVSATKENGIIRIEIVDNGYGVPIEYQEKIFQEFFKIRNGMREDIRGSGLGLAIARKIVKNHDGRLYCRSPIEKDAFPDISFDGDRKGSIFVVELLS